jgi:FKBP-type peptidyl-prolyl cis-trans isomerase 2
VIESSTRSGPLRYVHGDGKILSANETTASVRLMHPLVGRDIEYQVTVLAVRDPSTASGPPPIPGVVELDPDELNES